MSHVEKRQKMNKKLFNCLLSTADIIAAVDAHHYLLGSPYLHFLSYIPSVDHEWEYTLLSHELLLLSQIAFLIYDIILGCIVITENESYFVQSVSLFSLMD